MHSRPHEVVYTTRLAGGGTSPFRETDRHSHHDQPDHVHEHRPDGPRGPTPTISDDLQECIAVACMLHYCKWKAKADAMSISACKSASKISAFRLCIIWWSVGFSIFLKATLSAMSG